METKKINDMTPEEKREYNREAGKRWRKNNKERRNRTQALRAAVKRETEQEKRKLEKVKEEKRLRALAIEKHQKKIESGQIEQREDAWTDVEDEILLNNALDAINGAGTLTNAFRFTAEEIGRTASAVRFRYYKFTKHDHKTILKDAWIEKIKKINAGG